MSPLGRPPVMLDIVEEHFEELDFLWELREGIIFAPDWNLEELAEHEERCEAHLDGLRLAELHAVDIARPHLTGEEVFAATAATFVLMETGEPELQAEVIEALQNADDPARDGIRIGLRHSKIDRVTSPLLEFAAGADPTLAAAASDVLVFHRIEVPNVHRLLDARKPETLILVHGALGRQGRIAQEALSSALDHEDPNVHKAALAAAAMSGLKGLGDFCRAAALRDPPNLAALEFLGVLGDPSDYQHLEESTRIPEQAAAAIAGLGALARTVSVPLLIEIMEEDGEIAHLARQAFTRITGFDDLLLEKPPPPPIETPVNAEFEDDGPPPDYEKARAWWETNGSRFSPQGRWQAELDVSDAAAAANLDALPLESRRDLYLSLRAQSDIGTVDLELEARIRFLSRTRAPG